MHSNANGKAQRSSDTLPAFYLKYITGFVSYK